MSLDSPQNEVFPWGSGSASSGEWWWLKRPGEFSAWDPEGEIQVVAYTGEVYLDNGYGVHGWIPVSGIISAPATGDNIGETLEESVSEEVDELIRDGEIENYLPGFSIGE